MSWPFSIEAELSFIQSSNMSWRFTPTYRTLLLAVIPVLLAGCSSRSDQKAKPNVVPDTLTITVHAERGPDVGGKGLHIIGSTNLPDGLKMWISVQDDQLPPCTQKIRTSDDTDYDVIVHNGQFRTKALSSPKGELFPGGTHKVCVSAYFNASWQSRNVLALLGGEGGKALNGTILKLTDPDVIDSDKKLEDLETVIFPPLPPEATAVAIPSSQRPSQAEATDTIAIDKAIKLVKQTVLVVDGRRSSMTVEEGFEQFCREGIRIGNGWSATPTGTASFNVALDFINTIGVKEEHDSAIWEVNLLTKQVLYRNKYAKDFSWIPKD